MCKYLQGRIVFGLACGLLLAIAFAACGGDDKAAVPTLGLKSGPTIENGTVHSDLAYTAQVPAGWTALPAVDLPDGKQDTFVGPAVDHLPPTIAVRCAKAEGSSADPAAVLTATNRAHPDATPGAPAPILGSPAYSLSYGAGQPSLEVQRQDVIFAGGPCTWTISLTTAVPDGTKFAGDFEAFLTSFKTTS